jgi:DNA helicase-4
LQNNTETGILAVLNAMQKEAVKSDHDRILVLAGAGSGKTKTLLQKIVYLTEIKKVKPSQILAITFTKNAANEMLDRLITSADHSGVYESLLTDKRMTNAQKDRERLVWQKKYKWIQGLTVKTFHAFCYLILRNYGVKEYDNKFRIIGDEKRNENDEISKYLANETVFEVFHKLLIECCDDVDYLLRLKRYILDYLIDKIHKQPDYEINSYRGKYYKALDGTKVRSKSEQYIADWLYRHSIKYQYEPVVNIKDFDFRPDFYIPAANLYIEHISSRSHTMKNKEDQFEKGNILYVKTYESMTQDTALFNHILDSIMKNRLPEDYHKSVNLVFKEEFNGYHEDVKDFLQQVIRVTDMIKVEDISLATVQKRAEKDQHLRIREFYHLALPVIHKYLKYCIKMSYLDFNDLISRTTSLFRNHSDITEKFRNQYRYVLVDEFQDVNNLQVDLLKLILTPQSQLFCVGDDWQSIYGFRGSNINYILEFEKHFEKAKTIKLNLNYRSTQNIVGASNEVIKYNKFKVDKVIHASKKSEHKIVVYAGNGNEDNLKFCSETIESLMAEGVSGEDILFLYRRNKMYLPYFLHFRKEGIKVQNKTIHAAKGLEAKVVFIIGLTEGSGGFPDIWLEDRIFQVIKTADHNLLMEEERRLFYVAITRAKDKLYLITEKGNESCFLQEIPEIFTVKTSTPVKPLMEEVVTCHKCFSRLEKLWVVCPYCQTKVKVKSTKKS